MDFILDFIRRAPAELQYWFSLAPYQALLVIGMTIGLGILATLFIEMPKKDWRTTAAILGYRFFMFPTRLKELKAWLIIPFVFIVAGTLFALADPYLKVRWNILWFFMIGVLGLIGSIFYYRGGSFRTHGLSIAFLCYLATGIIVVLRLLN